MMRKKLLLIPVTALTAALAIGATYHVGEASDHDDGETDLKARALNLTDHFAFKSPTNPNELSLIMYFNPRSLPGRQYSLSTNARYEFHVSKAAQKTAAPTVKDDLVFRFEARRPDAAGVQKITLTVLKDGAGARHAHRHQHAVRRVEGEHDHHEHRHRRRDRRQVLRRSARGLVPLRRRAVLPGPRVPRGALLRRRERRRQRDRRARATTAAATRSSANMRRRRDRACRTPTSSTCSTRRAARPTSPRT